MARIARGRIFTIQLLARSGTQHGFSSNPDQSQHCTDLSFSPDGALLALARYRYIELYDYHNGQLLYEQAYGAHANRVIISPDKQLLIYGGASGDIVVRSIAAVQSS